MAFLGAYDFEAIAEEARRTNSKQVKRTWIKQGFGHQMSLYGAVYKEEKDAFEGRRIEILGDQPWHQKTLKAVADSFDRALPPFKYSIWAYSNSMRKLRLIGGYD